jgi:hypothetical protein
MLGEGIGLMIDREKKERGRKKKSECVVDPCNFVHISLPLPAFLFSLFTSLNYFYNEII